MKNGSLLKRVVAKAEIQHGKPCIKGTRTPVSVILEALSLGMTSDKVKKEYPPLTNEDIRACLLFASLLANQEELPISFKS